jgi:hypothetical protein
MNTTETDRREIDAHAVEFNETEHYNIDEKDAPHIKSIQGVYVFDCNEVTHCCELTGSYYLIHLYTSICFNDGVTDEIIDRLLDKYTHNPDNQDMYVHTAALNRQIEDETTHHYGDCEAHDLEDDIEDIDARHTAEMERIADDLRANCPF